MKIRKLVMLVVALAICVQGCYGTFSLVKKVYKWNGTMEDKWVKEAVFLGLCIVPVYSLATLGDAIVFNSLEFWTGKNPINSRVIERDGVKAAMRYDAEKGTTLVNVSRDGKSLGFAAIYPNGNGDMAATALDGTRMTARTSGDKVIVTGEDGKVLGTYRVEEANKYLN